MITPAFNLTATERVLPKLALDFTTASLDSRVTFTRTTGASNPATYVNSSGNIAAATNNQPRFDYDPVALTCKGLLIEESRANPFTYSQDFTNVAWTKTRCSVAGSAGISPDGTSNALSLTEDSTASNSHYFYYATTTWATGTYTMSLYIKAKTNNRRVTFYQAYGGVAGSYVTFDPNTGTIAGTSGSATGTMTAAGNGWYRCTITYTTTSTTARFDVALCPNTQVGLQLYTGDGTSGVYIWGAQLEAGAFATSYIPTTTAALTRNADVATMTGTNFSDWFNATEGTFVVQSTIANTTTTTPVQIDDGANNNRFYTIGRLNTISGTAAGVVTGGVVQANIGNFTFATTSKIALAYKENNFAASINGSSAITDTSGTIPTVDRLKFMYNNTNYGTGLIQSFRYWPQRLTNAEVQAITK